MTDQPNAAIITAPGTNCVNETAHAFSKTGAKPHVVSVYDFADDKRRFCEFDLICIPGGFSFADDTGAGRIFASLLNRCPVTLLDSFNRRPRPILGICNGFQVLLELDAFGLGRDNATLTRNLNERFECRTSTLIAPNSVSKYTYKNQQLNWPIAHSEGRFIATNQALETLQTHRQIILQYHAENTDEYPANPNGSMLNIAGICDPTGYILAMMPHPERALPLLTQPTVRSSGETFFRSIVEVATNSMT